MAAQQTGHTAPGVDRGEVQDAARLEQAKGGFELGAWVLEVLDHVPHGDEVVAVAARRSLPNRLVVHREPELLGLGDGPCRQLRALGP